MTDKTTEQTTGFEGESCEGCAVPAIVCPCVQVIDQGNVFPDKPCVRFKPSLRCRAVLAAKEANVLKRREVEAMEGLLEIARRGFPALLIRQDGSYVYGHSCEACEGSGYRPGGSGVACDACGGTGQAKK